MPIGHIRHQLFRLSTLFSQQLMISKCLSQHIANEKLRIAEANGMLSERRDTVIPPFTGPLSHLFARLDAWAGEQREALRAEIKNLVGL
jgi:hypothetical protein